MSDVKTKRLSRTAKAICNMFERLPPNRSLSSYALYCALAHLEPKPSRSSIYRNLRALVNQGYLTEVRTASESEFVLLPKEISRSVKLHCSQCHQTQETLLSPSLVGNIAKTFAQLNPSKIRLDLTVICEGCMSSTGVPL